MKSEFIPFIARALLGASTIAGANFSAPIPMGRRGGGFSHRKEPEKPKDPFHCIKSRGRTGAGERARLMGYAFKLSKIGKRNLRGRQVSNPFTYKARRDAFVAALAAGESRNEAMKIARRVSVA